MKESEESRRVLAERRRLNTCPALTKGSTFNVVTASCGLDSDVAVSGGQELRIKGLESVDHPELNRGGTRRSPWKFHHFVMSGASKLTLMNLKLGGAYSGSATDGGAKNCGHCQETVS